MLKHIIDCNKMHLNLKSLFRVSLDIWIVYVWKCNVVCLTNEQDIHAGQFSVPRCVQSDLYLLVVIIISITVLKCISEFVYSFCITIMYKDLYCILQI